MSRAIGFLIDATITFGGIAYVIYHYILRIN